MNFLPIVHRELLVRARQPVTWRMRWLAAGLALLVTLPALLGQYQNPAMMGQRIFAGVALLALAYCLFEGARQTSDCLSWERREGTLGLLFLTDLKGYEVVLGKLTAGLLNSFYSLIAILPVLSLPLLAGGVTAGEFSRMALVLVNTLFFALAMGMWVSSRSHEEMKALFAALALLMAVILIPLLLDWLLHWPAFKAAQARFSVGSPGFACFLAFAAAYPGAPHLFWISMAVIQTLSWGLLFAAAWQAQRSFREDSRETAPEETKLRNRAGAQHQSEKQRRLLESNPIQWLARRQRGALLYVWCMAGAVVFAAVARSLFYSLSGTRPVLGWGLFGYSQVIVSFAFRFLIAYLACRFFVEARRSGTLELLLCTPWPRREILRGQTSAFWRLIFWPVLFTACLQSFLTYSQLWRYGLSMGFAAATSVARLFLDALALSWFGMRSGLTSKRPATAVAQTFLWVVILPWVLQMALSQMLFNWIYASISRGMGPAFLTSYSMLNSLFPLLIDLAIIRWSKRRLLKTFCDDEANSRPWLRPSLRAAMQIPAKTR